MDWGWGILEGEGTSIVVKKIRSQRWFHGMPKSHLLFYLFFKESRHSPAQRCLDAVERTVVWKVKCPESGNHSFSKVVVDEGKDRSASLRHRMTIGARDGM